MKCRRVAPWLGLGLGLVACGGDAPAPTAGHQQMVAELGRLATTAARDNVFFGDAQLRHNQAELARLGDQAPWRLRLDVGTGLLKLGREREGIAVLAASREAQQSGRIPTELAGAVATSFHLGVGWMRLAETENCCAKPTQDTCILPLRGSALHGDVEGATAASHCFLEVLQNTAADDYWHLSARWLLNIAQMALGKHPEGVPEAWRIPAASYTQPTEVPRFLDVAPAVGLDTWGTAGGVVVEDFDGDEYLDLVVSDWAPDGQLRCFRNQRDGTFADVTTAAGLAGITGGLHLVQADYDNDGDTDVLVLRGAWWFETGCWPNSLLQNDGHGHFTDVTFAAGLATPYLPTQTAAFADYDLDGDLDLFVGNEHSARQAAPSQLFRNDGSGRFIDVAATAGVTNQRYAKGCAWGDIDGDRYPDLYVSNNDGPNRLYHNRGDGSFEDIAERAGVTRPLQGFPTWFWDFDNDGALDLAAFNYNTGIGHVASHHLRGPLQWERACFYRGDGRGGFREVGGELGFTYPAMPMGSSYGDLDNDGFLDFHLGTGDPQYYTLMPDLTFRNQAGKALQDVTFATGMSHLQKGHGVAFADLDHDGDQDVFEVLGGAYPGDAFRNVLFENPGFGNHHLTMRLCGTNENRSALGARIHLVVAERGQQRSIHHQVAPGGSFSGNPLRLSIGLGKAERIVRGEVHWPRSGQVQRFEDLPLDGFVRIVEGQPGWTRLPVAPVPFRRR